MAISRTRPMRPAEIDLLEHMDSAEGNIEQLQEDFAAIPVFEYGVSENNNVPASSSIGADIVFANEKQSTPYVLISVECVESNESPVSNCYGIIINASTTGFSVRLHNLDDTNAESININWLAIGE